MLQDLHLTQPHRWTSLALMPRRCPGIQPRRHVLDSPKLHPHCMLIHWLFKLTLYRQRCIHPRHTSATITMSIDPLECPWQLSLLPSTVTTVSLFHHIWQWLTWGALHGNKSTWSLGDTVSPQSQFSFEIHKHRTQDSLHAGPPVVP